VDGASRSVRAHIKLSNVEEDLKSNTFANVSMPVELDQTLVVPRDAVMMTGTRAIVFVQTTDGVFTPKEVQTGWEADGFIEIKKGLTEGEQVVSGANFLVDSESRLQAALEGMMHD
jgi:Cu(I)/Ag(I) efflux system membrane fusion protein